MAESRRRLSGHQGDFPTAQQQRRREDLNRCLGCDDSSPPASLRASDARSGPARNAAGVDRIVGPASRLSTRRGDWDVAWTRSLALAGAGINASTLGPGHGPAGGAAGVHPVVGPAGRFAAGRGHRHIARTGTVALARAGVDATTRLAGPRPAGRPARINCVVRTTSRLTAGCGDRHVAWASALALAVSRDPKVELDACTHGIGDDD